MKARGFERGDIVRVSFDPTVGREQQGAARPALVLSRREFNAMGTALVAPITQGGDFARRSGFAVTLSGAGTCTQGAILVNAVRIMDLDGRGAQRVESAPSFVVDDAIARLQAILD